MQVVNGYVCITSCDVTAARKHIDPAHPKDGVDGRDAPEKVAERKAEQRPAVILSGALSGVTPVNPAADVKPAPYAPGATVSLRA